MKKFQGFVVSSRRYQEQKAARKMQYVLEIILGYENVEVKAVQQLRGLCQLHILMKILSRLLKSLK